MLDTHVSCIWSPRYWDKKVLVNKLNVKKGKCYLFFACDRNYTNLYSFDGERVLKECQLCSNGKIYCYQIPLEWLVNEGELPKELIAIRDKEYSKFKKRMHKN